MTAVRLAICGLGAIGRRHAEIIGDLSNATLAAIIDPSDAAQAFAAKTGCDWFEDLAQLFDAQSPDGIVIATPTALHATQGLACIERGIPVLIEKPIATQTDDAIRLVRAAQAKDVPLLVGHHRRHNPLIKAAHSKIAEGLIGDVRAVHSTCWFYKPDSYFSVAPWRAKKGAGPISVNLAHDIDLMRHLCGDVIGVQAQAAASRRGYENEDVAAAILRFDNGAIGTITVSDAIASPWSWELTSGENPPYPKTSESCYLIGGSLGSLSIPDLRLWHHKRDPDWFQPIAAEASPYEPADPLVRQMHHFIDVVKGNADPLVSGSEGLKTLQVIEAVARAAETGVPESVSPLDLTST